VISVREAPNYDEDNADSQEVLEEITCRHLTRFHLFKVPGLRRT